MTTRVGGGIRARAGAAVVAAGVAVGLAVAGAATAGTAGTAPSAAPAKTIPTVPPAGPPASGEPEGAAPIAPDTRIGLPAGAGIAQLVAVANASLRATDDVGDDLRAFVEVDDGIDSPGGASITSLAVEYLPDDDEDESHFRAVVVFTTPALPADVVTFYQASLAAAGFVLTGDDETTGDGGGPVRRLTFRPATSAFAGAAVIVGVPTGGTGGSIELTVLDHLDPATIMALSGWTAGMPELTEGTPIAGSLRGEPRADGGVHLTMSTTYLFADEDVDTVRTALVGGLPAFGFRLRSDGEAPGGADATVRLEHNILDALVVTLTPATGGGTDLVVSAEATI